jgi:hypothetical protein
MKPGKEENRDASISRPISLLNVAGKVLNNLMIDKILHHVHSNARLNSNQYGFIPHRGTVDAAMAVKEIIEENLKQGNCTSVVILDVRGAFDAEWWRSILRNLKALKCPKNLFNLARSYFSNITASLDVNTLKIEKPVTMGCSQGCCSGPGFWNILYNSLFNMDFTYQTRVIAFADDLLVLIRGQCALEAEIYNNQDLKKIENWTGENKIYFNEKKSKVLMVTTKKSRDNKKINFSSKWVSWVSRDC